VATVGEGEGEEDDDDSRDGDFEVEKSFRTKSSSSKGSKKSTKVKKGSQNISDSDTFVPVLGSNGFSNLSNVTIAKHHQ